MLKGTVNVLTLMIFGEAVGLMTLVMVTRMAPLELSGLFLVLLNNLFLFGTIATLGLGTTFHRFVPQYFNDGNVTAARALIRTVMGAAAVATVASILAFFLYQNLGQKSQLSALEQILFACAIAAWAVVVLNRQLLRAFKLTFWSEFSHQVIRPVGTFLVILIGFGLFSGGSIIVFLALLIPLLFAIAHDTWRISPFVEGSVRGPKVYTRDKWLNTSGLFAVSMLARIVLQRLDLLVVAAILGFEAAAIYGVAARLALLPKLCVEPVQSMFRPRASLNFHQGTRDALHRDITQGALWVAISSVGIALVLVVAPSLWLRVFGDAFDPQTSVILLVVMIIGGLVTSNGSLSQALMMMGGHEKSVAVLNALITLIIYPPLLVYGTLYHGLIGAALATFGASCLLGLASVILAHRRTGLWGVVAPTPDNLCVALAPIGAALRKFRGGAN